MLKLIEKHGAGDPADRGQASDGAGDGQLELNLRAGIPHRSLARRQYTETRLLRLWSALFDPQRLHQELLDIEGELHKAWDELELLAESNHRLKRKIGRLVEANAQARHHAYHDELTGLPNRRLMADRFEQCAARALREGRQIGVMMLDLDGFKQINDRHGHSVGDDVLRHVGQCLMACTRASDTVSRFGGDEFIIMLPDMENGRRIAGLANKIHVRISAPYLVDGTRVPISSSIGTALYPADGDTLKGLLRQADSRMYAAKEQNRAARRHAQAGDSTAVFSGYPTLDPYPESPPSAEAQHGDRDDWTPPVANDEVGE